MSARDAARWAACRNMAEVRELVTVWLAGGIARNPDHEAPPCAETIPLIPVLTAVNRAGFLTDSSQRARSRRGKNAWVCGFVSSRTVLDRLSQALQASGLELEACFPAGDCEPDCPRLEAGWFWAQACPLAADEIAGAWWVYAEDPEPGRNDGLWPALSSWARNERQLARYIAQARLYCTPPERGKQLEYGTAIHQQIQDFCTSARLYMTSREAGDE
jgi:hypothetical protein